MLSLFATTLLKAET